MFRISIKKKRLLVPVGLLVSLVGLFILFDKYLYSMVLVAQNIKNNVPEFEKVGGSLIKIPRHWVFLSGRRNGNVEKAFFYP